MPTINPMALGKYDRLYIAQTTGLVDTDFVMINNENDVEVSWKSDKDSVSTKSAGKITLPEGDDSWQIKVTCDAVLTDTGFPLLMGTLNASTHFQVRDTKNNLVMIEGLFTSSDMTVKSQEKGVRQTTFTLDNAGTITTNFAAGGRAVGTSSGS